MKICMFRELNSAALKPNQTLRTPTKSRIILFPINNYASIDLIRRIIKFEIHKNTKMEKPIPWLGIILLEWRVF